MLFSHKYSCGALARLETRRKQASFRHAHLNKSSVFKSDDRQTIFSKRRKTYVRSVDFCFTGYAGDLKYELAC
jgi:hypothetical protein